VCVCVCVCVRARARVRVRVWVCASACHTAPYLGRLRQLRPQRRLRVPSLAQHVLRSQQTTRTGSCTTHAMRTKTNTNTHSGIKQKQNTETNTVHSNKHSITWTACRVPCGRHSCPTQLTAVAQAAVCDCNCDCLCGVGSHNHAQPRSAWCASRPPAPAPTLSSVRSSSPCCNRRDALAWLSCAHTHTHRAKHTHGKAHTRSHWQLHADTGLLQTCSAVAAASSS
jgi:hypothetical protein